MVVICTPLTSRLFSGTATAVVWIPGSCRLPGVLMVVVFLWWWVRRTVALWRMREPLQLARAATIASGALLLHSLVDYPLRTAALSSVFGLSIGLMVVGARRPAGPDRSTTGARHLTIEDLG